MNTFSFPGIGIEDFSINETAFSFKFGETVFSFGFSGIAMFLAIAAAVVLAVFRSKNDDIFRKNLFDICVFSIVTGFLGARLFYLLIKGFGGVTVKTGGKTDIPATLKNIISLNDGGLAFYGGLLCACLTLYLVFRKRKIDALYAFDILIPSLMTSQIIGRLSDFFAARHYGVELKSDNMLYFLRMGVLPNEKSATKMYFYHPVFLYEMIWNIIGLIIVLLVGKKKKYNGQLSVLYLTWYGLGRMIIEGARSDSLYIGVFRIDLVIGLISFILGLALLYIGHKKARKAADEAADYEPMYKHFAKTNYTDKKEDDKNGNDN